MKTKKIIIYISVVLLVLVSVSVAVYQSYKGAHKKLHQARAFLYENKIEKAGALFSGLEDSTWVDEQARLGLAITTILTGETEPGQPLPEQEAIHIEDFHLLSLIKRQFFAARFDACIKLARISRFYGIDASTLYLAAALLEKGETAKAFELYSTLPEKLRNNAMGYRLQEVFELIHAGAVTVVRDRQGEILGWVGQDNHFHLYRTEYSSFIQPVMVKEVLAGSIKKGFRLSIDLELSRLALASLGENKGSIVLLKPGTGEILAAVSDRGSRRKMGKNSSPAFEQMLEPASISKLITLTAAFRNKLEPDKEIDKMYCGGGKKYNGKILWCPAKQGNLKGLDHAMAVSCNTSFADLGVKVGWKKMLEELRLFGFDRRVNNPFHLGKVVIPAGDDRSLANLSIGLENTRTTPLHSALIAAVFANGGAWVNPRLLYARDGFTGSTPKTIKPVTAVSKSGNILDEGWLPAIRGAMWAVTRYGGTANFIAPIDFQVHMKTGTGGSYRDGYHINYIGYGPEESGNIVFCVRVTGKRTSYRTRRAGYRVNRELLIRLKQLARARGGRFWE
jgi:hypothetical protein